MNARVSEFMFTRDCVHEIPKQMILQLGSKTMIQLNIVLGYSICVIANNE